MFSEAVFIPQDSDLLNLSVSRSVQDIIGVATVFTVLIGEGQTLQYTLGGAEIKKL